MNTFGGGGFGQNKPAGFGQPAAQTGFQQMAAPQQQQQASGFGQPAATGFGQQQASGFGQRPQAGGFGQQPQQQQAAAGGFGQQQAGGFGQQQPAAGGFGQQQPAAGGFGQQQPAAGGFGQQQPAAGGFGQQQPAAGGFGQQQPAAGGFGQQQPAAGGFGQQQPAAGGFGQQQPAAGGFGQQPAAGGFGQQPQQAGGAFGQPAAGGFGAAGRGAGGFGQQQTGGFGQAAAGGFAAAGRGATGFGQQPAAGGFGQQQPAAGGFGQTAAGGFGQQQAAPGAFGQPAATGFGQQPAAGGFGQQPAASGFGQQQPQQQQAGGFGQAAGGGFAAAGRGTTGFGQQPAAGGFGQQQPQQQQAAGFGQQQPAAGAFGQTAAGGFGQQTAAGGFGQQQPAAGAFGAGRGAAPGFGGGSGFGATPAQPTGFGQQPAASGFGQAPATGFGQAAAPSTGFGTSAQQPAAGGFGAPATGGFGQAPAAPGFGQAAAAPAAGAQPAGAAAAPGGAYSSVNFSRPTELGFMSLPDLGANPYGNVLLFDTYERPVAANAPKAARRDDLDSLLAARRPMHAWMVSPMRVPEDNVVLKQVPASLASSAAASKALRDMLVPSVQLGMAGSGDETRVSSQPPAPPSPAADGAGSNAAAPRCRNADYVLSPSLGELSTYRPEQLRRVSGFSVKLRDGSVEAHFLDPVNLVRVDVGDVVHIGRDGRVALYPNGDAPPLRSGLNVRVKVRVRGEAAELVEALAQFCAEVRGAFVGRRGGWCVYHLNDSKPAADAPRQRRLQQEEAELSGAHPLSIDHDDDDEYSRFLEDDDDGVSAEEGDSGSASDYESRERPAASAAAASAAALPAAVVRSFAVPGPAASARSGVAERRVAVNSGADFKLPYELPDMTVKSRCEAFTVKLGAAQPVADPRVYYVRAADSVIQRTFVNYPRPLRGGERTAGGMLARSGRAGWSTAGTIAFASHAALRDAADGGEAVPEVVGARAVAATPFHWHRPATRVLTQCAVALLRCLLPHTDVAAGSRCPLAAVHLHRNKSRNTLSTGKLEVLQRAVEDVTAAAGAPLSRVEALSTRQTGSVLSLLSALYALPEADDALPNAVEEARYLRQLRHRNLASWLKRELATFLDETRAAALTPAEELVQVMLCHKLREARASAAAVANDELARVVRVCGEGNQFGGYVEMARGGFRNGEEVRQRVVGLLSGKVEPFITQEEYTGVAEEAGEVRPTAAAATWKQLLGIFTFYGCTPDTPAEDIILAFLDRLRAPSSRKLNPLPPYAERVDAQTLTTRRGRDLVRRGNTFQDAALLLLEGFAHGSAPPASCLHPHASSYAGTDYLTAFVLVLAVRAMQLPREQAYKDAEVSVLLGMTAELECNDETWFWGLLPLHLIERDADRADAVRAFCQRNAMRASRQAEVGDTATDLTQLCSLLRVEASWLVPVVAPAEEVRKAPENMPSVATHAALEKALKKLAL